MKLAVKIALLFLVAIGITAAIWFFLKKSPEPEVEEMALTSFEEYIEQRVNDEVKDQDFDAASRAYISIVDEIATEAFATRTGSSTTLNRNAERRCRRTAFRAFAPIFNEHARSYFQKSVWDENYIDSLRTMAQSLLSDSMLNPGDNIRQKLTATVTTVNDYHDAWRVARSANSCTTLDAVHEVTNKARQYQRDPLSNNNALMAALRDAATQARNSLSSYITGRCNHLAANYYSYASYEAFTQEYQRVANLVSAYKNEFGQNSLGQASTTLRNADTNAMNYFMGRRNNNATNNNSNLNNRGNGNNRGYRLETDGGQNNRGNNNSNRGNNRQERREY